MLTAAAVEEVFMDCLFKEGEDVSKAVEVQGVAHSFGFHPERLNTNRPFVQALLAELPLPFREGDGGGWSFLQACETQSGVLWGQHRNIEQLMVLGLATGDVAYLLPREAWSALPGGVPYFVVKANAPAPLSRAEC